MATEYSAKRKQKPLTAAGLRKMAVDAATEKINAKINDKLNHQLERLDPLVGDPDALGVWTRSEPPTRRPRLHRDDIAAAAMRIADAEGFEAVSMRRIAAELDAGTMTLYHYVRTKDELLTLVTDAFMEEVALPAGTRLPTNWRSAITLIALRSRDALRRHPWVLDISDDPQFGPNGVRHFDQSLQALAPLKVELQTKVDILMAVDEYVFGFCMHERNNNAGGDDNDLSPYMDEYLRDLLATGDYPTLSAMTEGSSLAKVWTQISAAMRDGRRFDRNLSRLLDGFEQSFRP